MNGRISSQRYTFALCFALAALVLAVYWPVGGFAFVNLDDPRYVCENPHVREGLSWSGIRWAFTEFHASNWHPLTWISHMLDVSLFGVDAGPHHLVNVAFHAANAILLFLFLRTATSAPWRSALVAALFAAHPLHVESVAWISERKDVLSTFFWLAALLAYVQYARAPSARRYVVVAGLFALGLMSKPMAVTLPATLLLVDVWPLGRWIPGRDAPRAAWPLLREKFPLFAMSLAAALVTVLAQAGGGAVSSVKALPMGDRLANALLSSGVYLRQTFWPMGLGAYYPHPYWTPAGTAWNQVGFAAVVIVAVTVVAVWQARRRPFLISGWGWYLVTLLPVIGLVQVGSQAHADRYTYVPLVGILWMLAWLVPAPSRQAWARAASAAALLVVASSAAAARVQAGYWRDSEVLFQRAIAVTEHNAFAWGNLGTHYYSVGDHRRSIEALRNALRIDPQSADNWLNLGASLEVVGDLPAAAHAFENGVKLEPGDFDGWLQLGLARLQLQQLDRAVPALERAVSIDSEHSTAWAGLAVARALTGDAAGAAAARDEVRRLDPSLARELDARVGPALAR